MANCWKHIAFETHNTDWEHGVPNVGVLIYVTMPNRSTLTPLPQIIGKAAIERVARRFLISISPAFDFVFASISYCSCYINTYDYL